MLLAMKTGFIRIESAGVFQGMVGKVVGVNIEDGKPIQVEFDEEYDSLFDFNKDRIVGFERGELYVLSEEETAFYLNSPERVRSKISALLKDNPDVVVKIVLTFVAERDNEENSQQQ